MTDISSLTSFAPQISLAAFSMYILWRMAIMFVNREKEKDAAHAKERQEWGARMDNRETELRKLESDIRNTFAVSIAENSNVVKQALSYMARRAKKQV